MHLMLRFFTAAAIIWPLSGFASAKEFPTARQSSPGFYILSNLQPDDFHQSATNESLPAANQTSRIAGGAVPVSPTPLTSRGKFYFYLRSTYGPRSLASTVATSAIKQARDAVPEWGQGMEGYGKRYASSFGQKAIKQFIHFGVGALWGEDPRYHASARTGAFQRAFYAAGQTFVSHRDLGGTRFAYSRFIGAVGGVCISRQWYPESHRSTDQYIAAAAASIGLDIAKNIFNEFWPDIKRRLRH